MLIEPSIPRSESIEKVLYRQGFIVITFTRDSFALLAFQRFPSFTPDVVFWGLADNVKNKRLSGYPVDYYHALLEANPNLRIVSSLEETERLSAAV